MYIALSIKLIVMFFTLFPSNIKTNNIDFGLSIPEVLFFSVFFFGIYVNDCIQCFKIDFLYPDNTIFLL